MVVGVWGEGGEVLLLDKRCTIIKGGGVGGGKVLLLGKRCTEIKLSYFSGKKQQLWNLVRILLELYH